MPARRYQLIECHWIDDDRVTRLVVNGTSERAQRRAQRKADAWRDVGLICKVEVREIDAIELAALGLKPAQRS